MILQVETKRHMIIEKNNDNEKIKYIYTSGFVGIGKLANISKSKELLGGNRAYYDL